MTNKNGLKPTTGTTWRKMREEGHVVKLPSGNVARLRPVALDVLITSGGIPDILTPIAAKTLWVETEPEEIGNAGELAKGYADLINLVVPIAFLEPRVVESPEAADEISLDDIDFPDKLAVFQLVTAGAEVLRRFRWEQEADVEAVRNGENSRAKAK